MSKKTVLPCAACGHENEPERVYCHNCGQKLDRSILPAPAATTGGETDADKRRRVQKMMAGSRKSPLIGEIKTFLKVVVFAVIVAAVVLFFLRPDDVPPMRSDEIPDRNVGEAWNQMVEAKQAFTTTFTELEFNYYLKSQIKSVESGMPGTKFVRAFVTFQPDTIRVTAERKLYDQLSIYSSVTFAPRVKDGGVVFEPIGVQQGRLGFDPRLTFMHGVGLGALKKVFEKEIGQFSRIVDVKAGAGTLQVTTKAAQ